MKKYLGWLVAGAFVLTAALQVNVLISNHPGERIERATIAGSATTPTITNQSGTWITFSSRTSAGKYVFTISPAFGGAPTCVCISFDASAIARSCNIDAQSTNSVTYQEANSSGVGSDTVSVSLICMGPR